MRLAAVALAFLTVSNFAAAAEDALRFSETEFATAQEGYLTLRWNEIAGAAEYQVIDDRDVTLYQGLFPEAFVSGLADGMHSFRVRALDANGDALAESEVPAQVEVKHWSVAFAMTLMTCGLVVFLAIISLIAVGTWRTRPAHASASEPHSEGSRT
ncbi:hypothetical protein Mal33_19440 [Rosistilla oblonga]|uniref:Fibronectin type-III domain-containing protein n=1 Tax=Rosistilla oblonga TaxID=2527990 RepID=A0A518IS95_9BACT|nr:hypothetical protein Mal33_19440 [Rosistilla oblonga]